VGFKSIPDLKSIYEQVMLTDPKSERYKKLLSKYLVQAETWLKTARQSQAEEKPLAAMPAYPKELLSLTHHQQPSTLYNGMVHALVPFATRGAIWYQGESNHVEGKLYTQKMKALIDGWRSVWQQDDFPFYYVQIAPYHYGNENPFVLAEFWEAQTDALSIPHTGMVVTNDIGNIKDIHPTNKQEVGRRFGLIAMANVYGRKELVYSGPSFKSMAIEGNQLRISFDHIGGGLASRDGKPLTHFELLGKEIDFVKATAIIDGNDLLVSSPEVKEPLAVRFAWHKNAEPNLMNKEGLPAGAFRAGEVPKR
jgi:sialate O-acetylesterase